MKIDIEGYELNVLMDKYLEQFEFSILFEVLTPILSNRVLVSEDHNCFICQESIADLLSLIKPF